MAKRYYDRQTKLEKFIKGDLVYVHDPIYKRGKAKKFSHKYKRPFGVVGKISPLIYKVKLPDGASAIVHINRLKRAYGQSQTRKQIVQFRNIPQEKCASFGGTPELDTEIPSGTRLLQNEDESPSETEEVPLDKPSQRYARDVDWAPRSLYLQRKLRSDKVTDGIGY